MMPRLRKLLLAAHVTFSVGWLGAVASFLVLSIAGLTSQDAEVVRGAYLAMNLIGLFVIVPMSFAALATGLVQALGSQWGLLRHYWVLVKFLLAIFATIALLMHQVTAVAEAAKLVSGAAGGALRSAELGRVGIQLVGDAGFAVLVLLVATTLAVYKPWGRTRYGRRKQQELSEVPQRPDNGTTGDGPGLGLTIFLAVIGVIVVVFVLLHLTGRGLGGHGL
jgi:hypothetical protein